MIADYLGLLEKTVELRVIIFLMADVAMPLPVAMVITVLIGAPEQPTTPHDLVQT